MPAIPSRSQQDRSPDSAGGITAGVVGVVGAGTMGNGIAQTCAMAGFTVVLVDTSQAALDTARTTIAASLQRIIGKAQLAACDAAAVQARIVATTDYGGLRECACVIEAVSEEPALKMRVLANLGEMLAGDTLLATNTSSISITALGAVIANPQRFIGLHFFNPVPLMPLVEVVRGAQTSDETECIARDFIAQLSKQPVLVADHPGFVVNRLLCPMLNEAFLVLGEGLASAADIDAAMKLGCSYPIGPLALADVIGLDVLLDVMKVLHRELASDKYRPAPRLLELVAAGELGRKSGRGVFSYHSSHSHQTKPMETP